MTFTVSKTIAAPAEVVFDWIADATNYTANPGVLSAKLTKPGDTERLGVGAEREIVAAGAWFRERITEYERPTRTAYQVVKSIPPLPHRGGTIELTESPEGTLVRWTLDFGSDLPVIGKPLTAIGTAVMSLAFRLLLTTAAQKCATTTKNTQS